MTLQVLDEDIDGDDSLIETISERGFLRPSSEWAKKVHNGQVAVVEYRVKVECDQTYYGYNCSTHCESRDDRHGHYSCDTKGKRICNEGWKGEYCKERKEFIFN